MKKKLSIACFFLVLAGILNAQSFYNYTTANGLPDNNVNGVAVDHNNAVWFATQTGAARFDGANWTNFTTSDGLIDNYLNCIGVDANNHVWVGTDIGLSMYDGTQWTSYTMANGMANSTISYIAGDNAGNVWFGTYGGLSKFSNGTFVNYTSANGLSSEMISCIAAEDNGDVWIGTWLGGLMKFNGTSFTIFNIGNGLPDNNISSIAIDGDGNKYIGTYFGIGLMNNTNTYITTITSANGLMNDYVKDLAFDRYKNLWVGIYADYLQEGGVSVFDQSSWHTASVGEGLVNVMVKRLAVYMNNHVWVATGNGVSEFIPSTTGIKEPVISTLKLYPNPASGSTTLSGFAGEARVRICNSAGVELFNELIGTPEFTLDTRAYAPGMYVVNVTETGITRTQKLLVK